MEKRRMEEGGMEEGGMEGWEKEDNYIVKTYIRL